MIRISKSKLKAHMLQVFRQIEESGEEVVVTDRGRPVLRIQPIARRRSVQHVFGSVRGHVTYRGALDEPTIEEWSEA